MNYIDARYVFRIDYFNNGYLKLVNSHFKMNPVDEGQVYSRGDMDVEDCTFDE